jgi:hypothetical protein
MKLPPNGYLLFIETDNQNTNKDYSFTTLFKLVLRLSLQKKSASNWAHVVFTLF